MKRMAQSADKTFDYTMRHASTRPQLPIVPFRLVARFFSSAARGDLDLKFLNPEEEDKMHYAGREAHLDLD